jgi:hypothetical protein
MTDIAAAVTTPAPLRNRRRAVAWPWLAGISTVAAGGLHLAAAGVHQSAGALHIDFFLLTAFAQFGLAVLLAVLLWQPAGAGVHRQRVLVVGAAIAATVALIGLYVMVHSTDLLTGLIGRQQLGAGHDHVHSALGTLGTGQPAVPVPPATPGTTTEPPETLGTITIAVELLALSAYTALLPQPWRRRTSNTLLALGGLTWALWLTGGLF